MGGIGELDAMLFKKMVSYVSRKKTNAITPNLSDLWKYKPQKNDVYEQTPLLPRTKYLR